MKAVILRGVGEPESLTYEDFPDPVASAGEVVVRLQAAALNHRDVWIRKGQYASIQFPAILGSDGVGVVESIGEGVPADLVGKSVIINPSLDWGDDPRIQGPNYRILGMPDHGTYAERVKVPAANVHARPEGLSDKEVAAIPLAALTAFRALKSRAKVEAGEWVLVTGIGGGVSAFALQLAKAMGARVVVTSGSDEKLSRAAQLGADGGFNYRTEGWEKEVVRLCDGLGPHVAIDSVGGETFGKLLDIVRPGGRIATYGATTGPTPSFPIIKLFWKQITLLGTTMGNSDEFRAMLDLVQSSGLKPVVDCVHPLAEAAAAHRHMEDAGQFGKIVLRP